MEEMAEVEDSNITETTEVRFLPRNLFAICLRFSLHALGESWV